MISESPTPNPVAERFLKLSKAYVKLANRYASLDVEHGKLRRILIKLLVSYRDLKNELADAQEQIRSMEAQNQELQQFQVLLGDDFLLALEEAEQAETSCEKLLSQEDQSLNHLALEVDEAVKQLEANLPIDVIGTEQPTLAEEISSPSSSPMAESVEAETTDTPMAAVTSDVAESTKAPEEEIQPEVEIAEELIYEIAQEAPPEEITAEVPAPSAAAVDEEEPVYEVVPTPPVAEISVSLEEEVSAEEELVYEVAKEPVAAEISAIESVKVEPARTVQPAEESKSQESAAVPVSPSDDWDLALGFFDVA
jgi:hypothetical protein